MMKPQAQRSTSSFASEKGHTLPSSRPQMDTRKGQAKTAFNQSRDPSSAQQGKAARRESFMVKRQQPKPTLRPAPHLSRGADAAAFNAAWQAEKKAVKTPEHLTPHHTVKAQTKENCRAVFKVARRAAAPTQRRNHTR